MKLIILQGTPGSGKSFKARQLVKSEENAIIVNRDDIRSMLGDYWVPSRELLVSIFEDNMIISGLMSSYTVIVDATNLNPKTIKRLEKIAEKYKAELIYIPIKINPKIAFLRILWRKLLGGRFISYKIVKGFYDRYKHIIGV
jgi:tRNA uridine 5-carbamoylmethylation protein Kti12